MRTKVLLAAAALTAGAFVASADVYSVNTVGYINLSLTTGYNLISVQLTNGNNDINVALTNGVLDGTQVYAIVNGSPTTADQWYADAGVWSPDGVNISTTILTPGVGYMVYSPAPTTVTLVGDVPQGTFNTQIGAGYGTYGSVVPVVSGFSTNGFPVDAAHDGMQYSTFTGQPLPGSYSTSQYYHPDGWSPDGVNLVDPAPAVGQGFLIYNPSTAMTWTRSFTVQ